VRTKRRASALLTVVRQDLTYAMTWWEHVGGSTAGQRLLCFRHRLYEVGASRARPLVGWPSPNSFKSVLYCCLRPPWDQSQGFRLGYHSHHPAMEPRGRSLGLLSRRTLTPRTWTFQGRSPVFRALVLSHPASARLRTTRSERRKSEYALDGNASAFTHGNDLPWNPAKHYSVVKCAGLSARHSVTGRTFVTGSFR